MVKAGAAGVTNDSVDLGCISSLKNQANTLGLIAVGE